MMIYRINLEVGYRSIVLDFNTAESAGAFASTFLSHINTEAGETKSKLSFQVINPELEDKEDE